MKLDHLVAKSKEFIKREWNKEPDATQNKLKKTWKQLFILFFVAMFGLTFLSRAADSILVAKVYVKKPQSAKLSYKIKESGTIKEKDTTVLKLVQGLMVKDIYANEGDTLKEGDLLLSYEMDDLENLYETKKAALEKYMAQIKEALDAKVSGKPKFICCHTIKGRGISFMENQSGWHGRPMTEEEFKLAMKELEG